VLSLQQDGASQPVRASRARLAHLRRFCTVANWNRPSSLCEELFGVDLKETVYARDASTIDLCLSVAWATFHSTKAAITSKTIRAGDFVFVSGQLANRCQGEDGG